MSSCPPAETAWSRALRKLLPPGAPLPDEDHLGYSFSVDLPPAAASPFRGPTPPSSAALPQHLPPPPPRPTSPARALLPRHPHPGLLATAGSHFASSSIPAAAAGFGHAGGRQPRRRRRTCARCSKGGIGMGILGEREECLACGARYCAGCVLRAMGSMPEGRKCVGCIGWPVEDVRRRARLGRGSRLLARLLAPAEVRQVMRAERGCAANQVLPDEIVVNGRGLSQDELDLLLGCAVPPERLAPGRYWYDKDSGLWGMEGERPDRIVTSKFSIGGKLRADASNGATQVFINGREITKTELRMLKGIIHHLFKILIRVFTGFSFSWPMYSAPEILISGYMMMALTRRRGKT